ncbi:MAG TPA: glycosyltransferase family 4 protein [Candidatus Omnitrophota bacterium]|nr:glycosyltransferase family 4 protein [Candidatus Omnitrophota bacterium]
MKILFVVHGMPPRYSAGTEVYTDALGRALSRNNDIVFFYRGNDLAIKEYCVITARADDMSFFCINNTLSRYSSFEDSYKNTEIDEAFSAVLEQVKPDLVHIQHLLYLSAGIIDKIRSCRIPVLMTLSDYWLICPQGQLFSGNASCRLQEGGVACCRCITYQLGIRRGLTRKYLFFKQRLPPLFLSICEKIYLGVVRFLCSGNQAYRLIQARDEFLKRACCQVDLFIAPSEYIRQVYINRGIPAGKIRHCSYGFNKTELTDVRRSRSSLVRFGYVGNLMHAKGVHILIDAFASVGVEKAELKIYGQVFSYKGALSHYDRMIRDMAGNRRNVQFMGGFAHDKVRIVYEGIDVLIVPSLWQENSPLVIQEAFLAKTPVIASRIGGIPELVTDGVNGLLFEPGNVEELRAAIERVIEDPSILDAWRANIPAVKSIEENAKELETIYAQLVSKP